MRTVRATLKMAFFALWSALLIPPQALLLMFYKGRGTYIIPSLWHRGMRTVFGIRCKIIGTPCRSQTIFVSNHVSYLDIPLLGSLLKASFLAKSEVASWPVFGYFSKLQQCVYVERKKTAVTGAKADLEKLLDSGRSLIVFPEGTSTSGMDVLPFKTSLFSITDGHDINIQPITIALTQTDGKKPVTKDDYNIYSWPLEMETSLPEHLWLFAKTSGARILLTFHEPIHASAFPDRKALANACHACVANALRAVTV